MNKITNKEKNIILELHRSIPMKSYLPSLIKEATESVPFSNAEEGNKFRGFVNDKYPDIAKKLDLDRNSPYYDNQYITNAWNYIVDIPSIGMGDAPSKKTLGQLFQINKWYSGEGYKGGDTIMVINKRGEKKTYNRNSPEWQTFYHGNNLGDPKKALYYWTGEHYQFDYSKHYKNWKTMTKEERKNAIFLAKGGLKRKLLPLTDQEYDAIGQFIRDYRHEILTVAALGSLLIPFAGPALSAAFGSMDAALYYAEGDPKTASLMAVLTILPGIGQVGKLIPGVTKLTTKSIIGLSKTLSAGNIKSLTPESIDLIVKINKYIKSPEGLVKLNQYADNITDTALKTGINLYKEARNVKKFESLINYGLTGGIFGGMLSGVIPEFWSKQYDNIIGVPDKEYILGTKDKLELNCQSFGCTSMVSLEYPKDLNLLKKAMTDELATACGVWTKNKPVLLKYQTNTFKSKNLITKINQYEEYAKMYKEDCRFPGTFGRPIKTKYKNKDYEFKFYDGKYYAKGVNEKNWIDITATFGFKDWIENFFKEKGYIKDSNNLAYVDIKDPNVAKTLK